MLGRARIDEALATLGELDRVLTALGVEAADGDL